MSVNVNDEIPQWAKERACELANAECDAPFWSPVYVRKGYSAITAFARYIAQHEQPPVDPDLEKAREICARMAVEIDDEFMAEEYRIGIYDPDPEVQFALSALKEARNGK